MDPLELFIVCLRASALSIGGSTALPLLRADLVAPGFITDRQVIESLTIGRLSTGPSGLYVVSLGYFALGWVGAAIALVASSLPPLALVALATTIRRQLLSPAFAGMVRGIALSTVGLLFATSATLFVSAGGGAPAWWQYALGAASIAIGIEGKRHPAIVIGIAAVVGVLLAR